MSALPEVCTFEVAGHLFGINAVEVQEIMQAQRITRVPLAPAGVAGLLNVRGELVTAIDLRSRLGFPARAADESSMNIVLRTADGVVSFLVDGVGEVVKIAEAACEPVPPTLRGPARALTDGVVKLSGRLLLRLNPEKVIGASAADPADSEFQK